MVVGFLGDDVECLDRPFEEASECHIEPDFTLGDPMAAYSDFVLSFVREWNVGPTSVPVFSIPYTFSMADNN